MSIIVPRKVYFLSVLIKCGLLRRKVLCGKMTTIIRNNQWTSFKLEYELVDIEINKSKVYVLVQNKLVRRNVYFLRIGIKNYPSFLKASKQQNSGHLPPVYIKILNGARYFL